MCDANIDVTNHTTKQDIAGTEFGPIKLNQGDKTGWISMVESIRIDNIAMFKRCFLR
ncbi:MAG: hypothetical protein VX737_04125 [Pseudomonadota bacterium]|nr:hypothetical protein [Pseudomonadota bacterium]